MPAHRPAPVRTSWASTTAPSSRCGRAPPPRPACAPLVDAYNATHKNQIELTVIPTDDYQTKVGAAAGSNGLPDLFSADVVFMPNWTSQGLFQDITSRIAGLPYADKIAQAHIKASTWDDKQYGLPFIVDLSVWMYNKELFRQAGLDPEKPPTTLEEFADQARAVAKLGGDIHGTFFGGNCGGCNVFTWWPITWADGQQVMNADGTPVAAQQRREQGDLLDVHRASSTTAPC